MKRTVFLLAIVLMSVVAMAQKPYVIQVVTDTTAKFNKQLFTGQFIYTSQDNTLRVLKVDVGPPKSMSWIMYSTARYDLPSSGVFTTSGNASIGGTLGVTGATTLSAALGGTTGTFSGALVAATLNTGQGANELYDMDQNVLTTSDVDFASVTVSGKLSSADTTGIVLRDKDGVYWRLRVSPTGVVGTFTTTTP